MQRQKGITLIGWLFLLIPVALVVYCAIRLTPVYLNYMKVNKSLNQVATEFKGEQQPNVRAVTIALQNRFDVESLDFPQASQVTFTRQGDKWVLEANYE